MSQALVSAGQSQLKQGKQFLHHLYKVFLENRNTMEVNLFEQSW